MVGLLPGPAIPALPTANLVLGPLGLTSTGGLIIRLWRVRSRQELSRRWPVLLALIIAMYAFQAATSFTATTGQAARSAAATFVMIFFAVGIARSWELLGLRGGGVLDFLVTRSRAAPGEPKLPEAGPESAATEKPGPAS